MESRNADNWKKRKGRQRHSQNTQYATKEKKWGKITRTPTNGKMPNQIRKKTKRYGEREKIFFGRCGLGRVPQGRKCMGCCHIE